MNRPTIITIFVCLGVIALVRANSRFRDSDKDLGRMLQRERRSGLQLLYDPDEETGESDNKSGDEKEEQQNFAANTKKTPSSGDSGDEEDEQDESSDDNTEGGKKGKKSKGFVASVFQKIKKWVASRRQAKADKKNAKDGEMTKGDSSEDEAEEGDGEEEDEEGEEGDGEDEDTEGEESGEDKKRKQKWRARYTVDFFQKPVGRGELLSSLCHGLHTERYWESVKRYLAKKYKDKDKDEDENEDENEEDEVSLRKKRETREDNWRGKSKTEIWKLMKKRMKLRQLRKYSLVATCRYHEMLGQTYKGNGIERDKGKKGDNVDEKEDNEKQTEREGRREGRGKKEKEKKGKGKKDDENSGVEKNGIDENDDTQITDEVGEEAELEAVAEAESNEESSVESNLESSEEAQSESAEAQSESGEEQESGKEQESGEEQSRRGKTAKSRKHRRNQKRRWWRRKSRG